MENHNVKTKNGFVDILQERRLKSDVLWASRTWKAASAYDPPHKYNAEEIKSIVLNSYRLKQILSQISNEKQVPIHKLYGVVEKILEEIGYKRKVSILRWLGLVVSKILKKLCTAVYVNEAKFIEIKSHMGKNPVLFVPSHKSYCDFILMSYVCFNYDVDIPRIAAGMDFYAMAVMGNILRDACAFFMRRSFTNDEVYSAVFSEYVQTLVTDGDAAIEFFIEGTRSRTSKSLMPKYGFLSMALKPFFTGLVPDITVIPIALSYDRVLEEVLFAYELLGVPKPKESTKGFLKALSILNENYGNMYIQFGDAISVKKYFDNKIDRSVHGFGSIQMQDLTATESAQIIHLAHTIVHKQKELTIISCFNLIATVLNNNIILKLKPFFLKDIVVEVNWLLSVLKVLTPSSALAVDAITEDIVLLHLKLHKTLVFISKDQQIKLCRIHTKNARIDVKKLKGHNLSNNTMDISIPLLMLQYYVNPCANFIIGICFMVLIVYPLSSESLIPISHLLSEFKFLCSVFSYEFVFHSDFFQLDFDKAFKYGQDLRVIFKADDNQVKKGDNEKLHLFCINFLSSYIPGYLTVIECLLESIEKVLSEKEILKKCQKTIELKLSNGSIVHPSNMSLDVLMNACQALVLMKALFKVKGKSGTEYRVNQDELQKIYSKLKSFDFTNKSDSNLFQQFSVFINNNL